ncbi:ROK family protein [Mollicutes bacterium LVI A0039]|nr:ROK family protein [Mollicutes bacterium LVI A0039]
MQVLAIDIGGTSIKSAIAHIDGSEIFLTNKKSTPFDNQNPSASITEAVHKYPTAAFEYVAVSATGVINKAGVVVGTNGMIENYLGLSIKGLVEQLTSKPAAVVNDVAAIGYAEVNNLAPEEIHLVIALGTGIGGTLIYKNNVLEGANGAFAEIGQIDIEGSKYEQLGSTKALVNLAKHKYNLNIDNGVEFFEGLSSQVDYQQCFEEWTQNIAKGLKQLIYCYNPHTIVLAGGVSVQADLIIPSLYKQLEDMQSVYINNLKIKAAISCNDAGLIGAVQKLRRELC